MCDCFPRKLSINCLLIFFRAIHQFSDIYQAIVMALFLWCVLTICNTMLLLQYGIVEFIISQFFRFQSFLKHRIFKMFILECQQFDSNTYITHAILCFLRFCIYSMRTKWTDEQLIHWNQLCIRPAKLVFFSN